MRKDLSFLLILFLVVSLVLTGCGNGSKTDENPIIDAQEKIELYYDSWSQLQFYPHDSLVLLGLATMEEIRSAMSNCDYLPDGTWYEETGITYADFESACLKLMTRELFEKEFLPIYNIVDGMVLLREHGGWSDTYEVRTVTYLGDENGRHQYDVQIENEENELLNHIATFIQSGEIYVIESFERSLDSGNEEEPKEEDPPVIEGEGPIADAYEKIELYHDCVVQLQVCPHYSLVSLGLATMEEIQSAMSNGGTLPDGTEYEETGITYADFESACLKLMTRELFEKVFLPVYAIVNDMLVLREHGGGSGPYEIKTVTYLGEENGRYQYEVEIDYEGILMNKIFTFVKSGDIYVISSYK